MKKLFFIVVLGCFSLTYAADGAKLYKKCIACHGAKADKVYLNKIPALNTFSKEDQVKYLKEYAAGTRNVYGQGAIMKINIKNMTEADFVAIADYIETLK